MESVYGRLETRDAPPDRVRRTPQTGRPFPRDFITRDTPADCDQTAGPQFGATDGEGHAEEEQRGSSSIPAEEEHARPIRSAVVILRSGLAQREPFQTGAE